MKSVFYFIFCNYLRTKILPLVRAEEREQFKVEPGQWCEAGQMSEGQLEGEESQ